MAEFIKIHSLKLIKGSEYYDVPSIEAGATKMEFVRRVKGGLLFRYISGAKDYNENKNGLIGFSSFNKFYQLIS